MNKDNAKDYLPLVQALAEGRTIQHRVFDNSPWLDIHEASFSDPPDRYRIKRRVAWVWWPARDDQHHSPVFCDDYAPNHMVEMYGGHITEVTE